MLLWKLRRAMIIASQGFSIQSLEVNVEGSGEGKKKEKNTETEVVLVFWKISGPGKLCFSPQLY